MGGYKGNADDRSGCINLLQQSRIGLYSTKGMDGDGYDDTHGFSQVTPRFFEYIATGNHILARWKDNKETEYFEIDKICRNIQSYEMFEEEMAKALTTNVNMHLYSNYLAKHYTSVRVEQLKRILEKI